jgi:hypothetical protein
MPVSFPSIDDGPNTYALQQGALRDAFGQLLDGNASLDTAGRSHELVEGDVAGRRQRDLLNGFRRLGSPRRAAEKLTPGFQPPRGKHPLLSLSRGRGRSSITPHRDRRQPNPPTRSQRVRERSRADSPRPCSPAKRHARWRDCLRARPRATRRYNRHGARSARSRATRSRTRHSAQPPVPRRRISWCRRIRSGRG